MSMSKDPKIEIPYPVRQMAEQSIEQGRTAYNQFMEMTRQATSMMAKSADSIVPGSSEVQARAIRFVEQNANASFTLAAELARARDLQEYVDIQAKFAQRQMQTYAEQAQEMSKMLTDLTQKAQRK